MLPHFPLPHFQRPQWRQWAVCIFDWSGPGSSRLKVKVRTLAIAPLTWVRLLTSGALQYRKWQLIGMSQWCRGALCGHPLPALTDNWTNGAASRHTIAPISHTRPSPHSHSYYSFPIPLRVGGWVGLEEGLLNEFVVAEDISWYCEMQNSFLVNLMQKLSKLVKICKVIAKKFTANFYWTAIILFLPVLFVFEKFRHGPPIRWREYRSGRPI